MAANFLTTFLKCTFVNENIWISLKFSLKFVTKVLIDNIPSIGADNGLALTRWQGIIRTNDGWFIDAYMRHSASVSKDISIARWAYQQLIR